MESAFASDLRGHLDKLFQNDLSVAEFRQWFMSAWWSAEVAASDSELLLGSRIENLVFILDSGVWSADQFRASLAEETASLLPAIPAAS